MNERVKDWKKIIEILEAKIGKHLNTKGNPNLTEEDYYYMHRISLLLEQYQKIYK